MASAARNRRKRSSYPPQTSPAREFTTEIVNCRAAPQRRLVGAAGVRAKPCRPIPPLAPPPIVTFGVSAGASSSTQSSTLAGLVMRWDASALGGVYVGSDRARRFGIRLELLFGDKRMTILAPFQVAPGHYRYAFVAVPVLIRTNVFPLGACPSNHRYCHLTSGGASMMSAAPRAAACGAGARRPHERIARRLTHRAGAA